MLTGCCSVAAVPYILLLARVACQTSISLPKCKLNTNYDDLIPETYK